MYKCTLLIYHFMRILLQIFSFFFFLNGPLVFSETITDRCDHYQWHRPAFLPEILWSLSKQTADLSDLFQCRNHPFIIWSQLFNKAIYPLDLLSIPVLKTTSNQTEMHNTFHQMLLTGNIISQQLTKHWRAQNEISVQNINKCELYQCFTDRDCEAISKWWHIHLDVQLQE